MKDTPGIYIRQATTGDMEFIISLVPRLAEFGPPSWRNKAQMITTDTNILMDKLTHVPAGTVIFVATDSNNIPLGFIHLQSGSDYYNKEPHGHISDIVVAPGGEGKGTGRRLMEAAEAWARTQGYRWLTLSVFAQNVRAREVYERIGYEQDIMKYVKEL